MKSNLEIFLLALVQADVRTPYDMMSKAGVSLGSSLPALNRLVAAGLVDVSKEIRDAVQRTLPCIMVIWTPLAQRPAYRD